MTEVDPLLNSPLDGSFREARLALLRLARPDYCGSEDNAHLQVIVQELEDLAYEARETAAAHLGPSIYWAGPDSSGDLWAVVTIQVDLDGYADDDPPGISHINNWDDSALARASRAYRRECGWDFSPGEAGVWLLSVAPYSCIQASGGTRWSGTLAAFVILHDRDVDGRYESLAHLWTAHGWRRRGVGAGLVREARRRFPLTQVEGPVTESGRLLLEACAPDLLE